MNYQSIVGILLISSAVVLTGYVMGGVFDAPLESMDRPSSGAGYDESPRRLNDLGSTINLRHSTAATKQTLTDFHPPIVGANSVPVPQVSVQSHLNQPHRIQTNGMRENMAQANSGFETPERAELITETMLPDLNGGSGAARLAVGPDVSRRQVLNQPRHSVSEVQQQSKSHLQEHFSTARSKYVQNRFVKSEGQQSLAERVLALERNSHASGNVAAPRQEPPAVQRASYESKIAGSATSVLVNEPMLSGPATAMGAEAQSAELPGHIAPTNRAMGMSMQQPALQKLRVVPQVEVRAREHIGYGESLARRNSYMAAREEFTLALLLIARSHKAQSDPDAYSNSLAQGLTALDEAADFVGPSQPGVMQQKVLSHRTKLISPNDIGNISRTKALDLYCGFAQSKIELAIGYSAAGSAALHTLGKIETRSSVDNRRGDWTGQARALVFFRAAMSCNPANAVCANDLGVLLHDMGRLKEAEQVLKVAITSSPTRSAWANLSAVHSQLAMNAQVVEERDRQTHLAKLAAMRAEQSGNSVANNGGVGEQWATMNEFHNNAAFPNITTQRAPQSRPQTSNQRDVSPAKALLKKVKGWY